MNIWKGGWITDKYLHKWSLTNGWIKGKACSLITKGASAHKRTQPHYNIIIPYLFIHLLSTHQLNPFPLARPCTLLASSLPSVSLSEFLFNLQDMFLLMDLSIWCCASCFYLQELKGVLERRDALPTRVNLACSVLCFNMVRLNLRWTETSWWAENNFKNV